MSNKVVGEKILVSWTLTNECKDWKRKRKVIDGLNLKQNKAIKDGDKWWEKKSILRWGFRKQNKKLAFEKSWPSV